MLYGIISDIHGKVKALHKALSLLKEVDQIIFLGDVPNYRDGAGFYETLEILHQEKVIAVRGNCDAYVLYNHRPEEVKEHLWDFYEAWPTERRIGEDILLLHGGPRDPLGERIHNEEQAWKNFNVQDFRVCFHGHQHTLTCFEYHEGDVRQILLQDGQVFSLQKDCRYIVGVGSVGEPRDHKLGSFVLYDQDKEEIQVKRFSLA
ncbi:metallophosphoesterase family protein [Heliorestis acidaminivorans]|uniref:Metallophosphoesterase family protein n=1 Tax=Heliorestis acidaminivorans TaxID=553427 RepID=A0A6I0EUX3_9FIRM|nr:metallophosphoesterase family protein [Heliorestis acidaminivorans]KAB2954575.1 metallophosphoesterase family protein [Heliorestis acidaminivorans]